MYNEEKEYTEGKVILSTKEYRDLIEENITNKKDFDSIRNQKWEIERQRDKLKEDNKKLRTQVEGYQYYLKEKSLEQPYKIWLLEQQAQEEE